MEWKPLLAVLLGLLIVGVTAAGTNISAEEAKESDKDTLDIELLPTPMGKMMYFYGENAGKALVGINHTNITLRIVSSQRLSRVTFAGVYWDTHGRVYYYIVEGPVKKEAVLRDFIGEVEHFSKSRYTGRYR
ncbi:hypothetical protein [Thermococcus aciditolerans]|uniref:Uncharacterized protein n=1 Tax=Thermococcus aciditolerans TaxID=2598455 RepID=A0A5C0SKV7_9EURY|nr:hypothetical protein [Thermococcus aciditolerans]QEK15001.1 hypothetical protein FPV09_07750 [Thermococcus aciditolerans]